MLVANISKRIMETFVKVLANSWYSFRNFKKKLSNAIFRFIPLPQIIALVYIYKNIDSFVISLILLIINSNFFLKLLFIMLTNKINSKRIQKKKRNNIFVIEFLRSTLKYVYYTFILLNAFQFIS